VLRNYLWGLALVAVAGLAAFAYHALYRAGKAEGCDPGVSEAARTAESQEHQEQVARERGSWEQWKLEAPVWRRQELASLALMTPAERKDRERLQRNAWPRAGDIHDADLRREIDDVMRARRAEERTYLSAAWALLSLPPLP
jgi:hypothetical protein